MNKNLFIFIILLSFVCDPVYSFDSIRKISTLSPQIKSPHIVLEVKRNRLLTFYRAFKRVVKDVYGEFFTPGYLKVSSDYDARPITSFLLNSYLVRYYSKIKEIVNPNNEEISVIYGAAGIDVSGFLLKTNAATGYFVSQDTYLELSLKDLRELKNYIPDSEDDLTAELLRIPLAWEGTQKNYQREKFFVGYGHHRHQKGRLNILEILANELNGMGIDWDTYEVNETDGHFHISFDWQYHGTANPKRREIFFITASLEFSDKYPRLLREVIVEDEEDRKVAIYLEKAAMSLPGKYHDYLPVLFDGIKEEGYMILDGYGVYGPFGDVRQANVEASIESLKKGRLVEKFVKGAESLLRNILFEINLELSLKNPKHAYGLKLRVLQKEYLDQGTKQMAVLKSA